MMSIDKDTTIHGLKYSIHDTPPWYYSILMGLQHYLIMFGACLSIPLIIAPALCMGDDNVSKSELIGTIFFVSGLNTIFQATFGVRLPIVQGGTFTFLAPTFVILNLPKWKCPDPLALNTTMDNMSMTTTDYTNDVVDRREIWQPRIRELQGAIILSSLFQIAGGLFGIMGLMLQFIGPLAVAPIITLVGLGLFEAATNLCQQHWGIAFLTMFLVTVFSQYLRNVELPCLCGNAKDRKCYLFQLFPVLLAILLSWGFCAILTVTDVFPKPSAGDLAMGKYGPRVDTKIGVLEDAKWFRFPYPFQWGTPTFSTAAVFGMLAGVLAGMVESVGDYYACAKLVGAPPVPVHAVNRGILVEGLGCLLAGLWGSGTGTATYSENIGAIGITKVGSRRVIQWGGLIMMIFAIIGKFGALFVTLPDPIVGGLLMVMFGMIAAVGVSNLQYVDLNSPRNLYIFGLSILLGLAIPSWLLENTHVIDTGSDVFDQICLVLLETPMFIGGVAGFVLDNTVPGTTEERGLLQWQQQMGVKDPQHSRDTEEALKCYDLPFGMSAIRKVTCFRFIPFCPTFHWGPFGKSKKVKAEDPEIFVQNNNNYIPKGQSNGAYISEHL